MSQRSTPSPAHWAVVTSVSPLEVRLQGSTTSVPALTLDSYSPSMSDRVAYVLLDSTGRGSGTILVLGLPT